MLEKMIFASTDYLVRHQVIDKDDRDIYEYGFHALYNNIIDITSIVIIALWLNMLPQTIIYHIAFISLRNTAGGYHTTTHLRCFIMSTMIFLLSLFGIAQTASSIINIGLACLSVIIIWMKAPVEHMKNPLSIKKYERMKIISRTLSMCFLCTILCLCFFSNRQLIWIATSLAFGSASHSVLIAASLFEKHYYREKA